MSIGYACLTMGVQKTTQKSCILKNASHDRLLELIAHNLNSLENIVDYNIKNNIRLFRISSDLIPFGSSPVNRIPWWDVFATELFKIGEKIQESSMRVSMHPGQYTVLNSPNDEVVKRAVEDLKYHAKVLDSIGVGIEHKIVLHVGGIYNDKRLAIKRFIDNYKHLHETIKNRLVLENDDKSYNIMDVLEMSAELNSPVVYDNLHNKINSYDRNMSDFYWINKCRKTWKGKDGYQKTHYSQQNPLKKAGSHSNFIRINEFMAYYKEIEREDLDIMLEVKDKNLSAIKCINATSVEKNIRTLELEWKRYKYKILENSPSDYISIGKLLRNKNEYPVVSFYHHIENSLQKERTMGNSINAALHIWEYFKDIASDKESISFLKSVENYRNGKASLKLLKKALLRMAIKYNQSNLVESYYFIL